MCSRQDPFLNKVKIDLACRLVVLAAFATCFYNTFDGFIDAVYLTLRLHAVSKQTAHQDEWQVKEWELDQLRGLIVGQMIHYLPQNKKLYTRALINILTLF